MKPFLNFVWVTILVVLSISCRKDGTIPSSKDSIEILLSEIRSKGEVVTTDLLRQDGLFGMNAILDEQVQDIDSHYINHLPVEYISGAWKLRKNGQSIPWVPDVNISFWGYYPYECMEEDPSAEDYWRGGHGPMRFDDGVMSFQYSSPRYHGFDENGMLIDGQTPFFHPENFNDLLLSYTDQNQSQGSVKVKFKHSLATIQFDLSRVFANHPDVSSLDFVLYNIYGEGVCSFDPSDPASPISWITYPLDPQSPYALGSVYVSRADESYLWGSYFVVPQITPLNAIMNLNVYPENGEPRYMSLQFSNMKWEAGKIYKYRLDYSDDGKISFTIINGDLDGYRYQGSDDQYIIVNPGSETDGE